MPTHFPSITAPKLAYKDFEGTHSESWNTIFDSPILEDGDIIQIIRKVKK